MESYGPTILRIIVGMIEHRRARFAEADAAGRGRLRGTL